MYLAGSQKRSRNSRTLKILLAFFLLELCILACHANAYGQIAAGETKRGQLPGGRLIARPFALEVASASDQSALQLGTDKLKNSDALRRKLLISSVLFVLLLLILVFFVAGMLRQLRKSKEPKKRAEPPKRDIITVSIGPYTFFFGNPGEESPNTAQSTVRPMRMHAE